MYDLEKSDIILCNKRANNIYKHTKENDAVFLQRMGNTQMTQLRNFDDEFALFTDSLDPKKYICNEHINTRGGNAVFCDKNEICSGFKCYTKYHMNDYLMTPCKKNTWRNHIECDNNKCCTILHQMYDNVTKRR